MKLRSILLLCFVSSNPVYAEQSLLTLDEIVVSPNRGDSSLIGSGQSVTVVTASELEAAGSASLSSILALVPGLQVTSNGPTGSTASVSIRGNSQRYTAIYIDGIRVDDPTSPQVEYDIGTLLASDVSRIEVLKGSHSAVYGGSAVGGVIYITTKRSEQVGRTGSINLEAGSYNTKSVNLRIASSTASTKIDMSFNRFTTDGFSALNNNPDKLDDDGFSKSRLAVGLEHSINQNIQLGARWSKDVSKSDYDSTWSLEQDWRNYNESGKIVFLKYAYGKSKGQVEASNYQINRLFSSGYQTDGSREAASYRGSTQLSKQLQLRYGIERTVESMTGRGSVITESAYGGFELGTDQSSISYDVRQDKSSKFGTVNSSRVSSFYRLSDSMLLKANYGTGFRAPSPYESAPTLTDNPDSSTWVDDNISPEDAETFYVGMEFSWEGFLVDLSLFQTQIDNAITYCTRSDTSYAPTCAAGSIPTTDYNSLYINIPGKTRTRGFALSGSKYLGSLGDLSFSYTKTMAKAATGERLANIPTHFVSIGLISEISDRLTSSVSAHYSADNPNQNIKDYSVVNVSLSYDINESAVAYFRINNLFDENYSVIEGYNTERRSLYFGVNKSF